MGQAPQTVRWRLRDGYTAFGRIWPPADDPRHPIFLYLHGIQSHGAWFCRSAEVLAERGAGVILPDRRGSGQNQEARGDVPSIRCWLDDLDEIRAWALKRFGSRPLALVGVSWGGKLAVAWALRHRQQITQMLLIAPGVFPAVGLPLGTRARLVLSLLSGGRRPYPIPLSDPAMFTDNPKRQVYITKDRAKLTEATARFLYFSHRLDARLRRAARGCLTVPTTLLLAERDRIIRNAATHAWLERVCAAPPAVKTLAESHTLEFAADPREFLETVRLWRDANPIC